MGEMADYINIAVLGTVDTRTGEVTWGGKPIAPAAAPEIKRMQQTCRQRNIPLPEIFDSEYGYKRARCACGADFAIRGYLKHYARAHVETRPVKLVEVEESADFDALAPNFDEKAWRARAQASHDRIIKRFA